MTRAHHASAHGAKDGGAAHGAAAPHGTTQGYLLGFILAAALTAAAFWLTASGVLGGPSTTVPLVLGLGLVQIIVHMVFFLHMSPRTEGGWTLMALIFTAVLVVIALSGSIWVMYHLNANMMPMTPDAMRRMP